MSSLQVVKKRLGGAKSIRQMTSAMELVSATKMRRAQETALQSRPYALTALEILADIVHFMEHRENEDIESLKLSLLTPRNIERTAVLIIASDKGLAGSFNSSVFKKFETYLSTLGKETFATLVAIPVGQKAVDYVKRKNLTIEHSFTHYGDHARLEEVAPLAQLLIDGYEAKRWDRVLVFSTHFVSALRQEVIERQLLPIDFEKIRKTTEELIPETGKFSELRAALLASRSKQEVEYVIEPSPKVALKHLVPQLLAMQVYHIVLEANASEHSARRLAMKNASDNASDLIDGLTLEYNRSRQSAITKEIIEITGTAAALH